MTQATPTSSSTSTKVQRQIVLPLSKAVEIAWKSIRLRLSRSLLVTSGIVLAVAFLMSIRTTEALVNGMRNWRDGLAQQALEAQQRGDTRLFQELTTRLSGPQSLDALFRANGVPTTAREIADDRTHTRWLLSLALLVAFVGILNAMLMSVTERFREIGTMKCLGALDSFIIKLFLIESLFQGIVGTTLGVACGLGLSMAAAASGYGGYAFKAVPWGQLASGAALCMAVGVGLTAIAAVYPAWQAARMQPIEAMRVEA